MLVPLTTRTWIDDAPGTIVACVVVVVRDLGAVVEGDVVVVVGVVWLALTTFNGARVAEGISSAPMTTATTTTPAPRRNPEGADDPDGSRPGPSSNPPPEPPGAPGSS
jgi:hypothetical protein